MTELLLVCVGALVGAPARYMTDRAIQTRHDSLLPWGTILVNLTGSFVFGVLTGVATTMSVPTQATVLIATGLCGTFTTYSTFAYEALRLVEDERWLHALENLVASIGGGLGAAFFGYTLGTLL